MPEQTYSESGHLVTLPDFPRPDLPESHPENFPTLRLRCFRRLGLPDDGRSWLNDAITPEMLHGYSGVIVADDEKEILISFPTLFDAVSWADGVTIMGRDREMLSLVKSNLYGPASVRISL